MIVGIIFIITSILISIPIIIYLILNREKYFNQLLFFILSFLYYFLDISFTISFAISTEIIFNEKVAHYFWNLSIMLMIFMLAMMSTIHSYILLQKKTKILIGLIYSFIGGIIISFLFIERVFKVEISKFASHYIFKNLTFFTAFISYIILVTFLIIYTEVKGYHNISDKKLGLFFNRLSILFCINNAFYGIFLIVQIILFRILFLSVYLTFSLYLLFIIIKKPDMFAVITNKIYDLIIFHKSGILLYSFDFELDQETDESILKGSILIGISHILNNFIDKKNKLNVVKMKDKDIILEYDNEFGYAILIVVKHKNIIIEKAVQQFIQKFNEINKENLIKIKNMSQIIDISEFKGTKFIIDDIFGPFIFKS